MQRVRVFESDVSIISYRRASDHGFSGVVVITFDAFGHNDIRAPGFAELFFINRGVDVVAVQKTCENWYQDLTREKFAEIVGPILSNYRKHVLYGSSVGAYAALYFNGAIGGDVLAFSPLVSIHPDYPGEGKKEKFRHSVVFRHRPLAETMTDERGRCMIVFDPALRADRRYVENEVLPAFPHASIYRLHRSTHPCTRVLSEAGVLKEIAIGFVQAGATPHRGTLIRAIRHKSKSYLHALTKHCIARGRYRWALAINQRALGLAGADIPQLQTRAELLERFGQAGDAMATLDQALSLDPANAASLLLCSRMRLRQNDLAGSLAHADRALAVQPSPRAHMLRSEILESMGALIEADRAIASAMALAPSDAGLCALKAERLFKRGHLSCALSAIDTAIGINPKRRHSQAVKRAIVAALHAPPEAAWPSTRDVP